MYESLKSTAVLIPAYEPTEKLVLLVGDLAAAGCENIIVIDDGSKNADDVLGSLRESGSCTLLSDEKNHGKGYAIRRGLNFYLDDLSGLSGVVIADANYRYDLDAIGAIADAVAEKPDELIIGSRDLSVDKAPLRSRLGNRLTRWLFHICHGVELNDTQSGLRGIPDALVPEMASVERDRYEYETKMLIRCADEHIKVTEIPVDVNYDGYGKSNYRVVRDTVRVCRSILKRFIIYTFASASSTLLDMLVFNIVLILLPDSFAEINVLSVVMLNVLIATVTGRVIGTIYNFFINQKLVFKQTDGGGHTRKSLTRFFILNFCQMIVSATFVSTALRVFGLEQEGSLVATCFKCVIEVTLFFLCYRIQREWVFGEKKDDSES